MGASFNRNGTNKSGLLSGLDFDYTDRKGGLAPQSLLGALIKVGDVVVVL